ncbi:MAG: helix-turn-helix transcriptional regulator [Coxiellaceae bacterium]|nr:MAG: helix-turn-helix transcriptional regulator [Coxiellaceae bacterium]
MKKLHLKSKEMSVEKYGLEKTLGFLKFYPNIYLTKREIQCLQQFVIGKNNERIAETLNISTRTVEFYFKNYRINFIVTIKKIF